MMCLTSHSKKLFDEELRKPYTASHNSKNTVSSKHTFFSKLESFTGHLLIALLTDREIANREMTADVIWNSVTDDEPLNNSLTFILGCLRDVIQGIELFAEIDFETAWETILFLRIFRPNQEDDFNRCLIYSWCQTDERLAYYAFELLRIYTRTQSFTDSADSHQIGRLLHRTSGTHALNLVHNAINISLGPIAARNLKRAWADLDF